MLAVIVNLPKMHIPPWYWFSIPILTEEMFTRRALVGGVVGFAGIVLLMGPSVVANASDQILGIATTFLGPLSHTLTSAISVPAAALLADWGGWRFTFLLSGLLMAAGFLTNWFLFPRDNQERVRDLVIFSRYRALISTNFFRVALPVNLTQRLAYWALVSFFAAYVINTYEVSVGFVALPLAITAIGQVIGSYAAGFMTGRYRAILIASTTVVGGFCGFLFFTVDFELWFGVALATVGSGLLSVTFPALVVGSTEYSGESKATGVGLMGLSNQSGGVLGALTGVGKG